ncbi:MAG: hypothetical protein IJY89_07515 [Clostridia bacterium]|nr:hypothetical protein [Clostridia bacterium]
MEERNENRNKVIKAIVIVLAVLGLISAIVVVCNYLYKKFKKAVAAFNEDIANEELNEQDLTDMRGKNEKERAEGCQINCAD